MRQPFPYSQKLKSRSGFTLIELSIVLVIIGLIVGGVLAGTNLVRTAGVRATLAQVEKYNTAANAFRSKYGELPGDMDNPTALSFGFTARTAYPLAGMSDGNGIIEGNTSGSTGNNNGFTENCETVLFWQDLTVGNPSTPLNVNMVDGTFSSIAPLTCYNMSATSTTVSQYLPAAKLGNGNYIFIFSTNNINYFGLEEITAISNTGTISASTSLSPQQAYAMDKKVDDGLPTAGNIIASYINGSVAANTAINTTSIMSPAVSSPAAITDCYDSAGVGYALFTKGGGNNSVCGLSFQFMQ